MPIDFRRSQPSTVTIINGEASQTFTNYKYLGILLDDKLKWNSWTHLFHMETQHRTICDYTHPLPLHSNYYHLEIVFVPVF